MPFESLDYLYQPSRDVPADLAYLRDVLVARVVFAIEAMGTRRRRYAWVGELPMTPFGFRSMAGGPFESLDPRVLQALGWTLVGVCALDVVAGVWLWQGRTRGARLGLVTDAPAFVLAAGFALPFLLAGVPIRAALVITGRRSLA